MVGTSGPGLSLKVEEFGVSGVSEVPMVIVDTQRAGPSTGMPTKSEQGDLFLVAYGGHGEIPRIVLAPATQEECYTLMIDAHNLADKYQCPVFFLTDLNLSEGRKVVPESFFGQQAVRIDRSTLVRESDLRRDGSYKRFALTPSGTSPRLVPGTVGGVIKVTGSEHDERGFVSTDPAIRKAMMEKRARKMEVYLDEDVKPPQVFGKPEGKPVLVGWGSTRPLLQEAQQRLRGRGVETAVVHFTHLWPFHTAAAKPLLEKASAVIAVEQNFSGQFADVIQTYCLVPVRRIVKYNGLPIYPSDVVSGVRRLRSAGRSEDGADQAGDHPVRGPDGGRDRLLRADPQLPQRERVPRHARRGPGVRAGRQDGQPAVEGDHAGRRRGHLRHRGGKLCPCLPA